MPSRLGYVDLIQSGTLHWIVFILIREFRYLLLRLYSVVVTLLRIMNRLY